MLVNVKRRVSRSEHLGPRKRDAVVSLVLRIVAKKSQNDVLINVISTNSLEDLSLNDVTDTGLGHDL